MAALRPGGARDFLSTRSRRYRELKDEIAGLEGDALLAVLAREPQLLRRPLITDGRRCVVGYDPEGLAAMFAPREAGGGQGSGGPGTAGL